MNDTPRVRLSWLCDNSEAEPLLAGLLMRLWVVHGHLLGYPETHAPAHEAEPHHQIVLLGAVEFRHSLAEEAGVDEKARNARDRVMLERKNKKLVC